MAKAVRCQGPVRFRESAKQRPTDGWRPDSSLYAIPACLEAKGITAQRKTVTVDHAYQLMRGHARNDNASLRTVAEAIVGVGLLV